MNDLLPHLGYATLFLGTLLEGETFILVAGFLSHQGYLNLELVLVFATLGAFGGDLLYFLLGRRYGRALLEKGRRARALLPRLESWIERYHVLWIFGMKYLYGIRWLVSALAGSSRMSLTRFSLLSLPACLLWAVVVGLLGYAFGDVAERLLGHVERYELVGALVLALAVLAYALVARQGEQRWAKDVE